MYKGKRIVAIIPARGGSKGIPNKNLVIVNNKPLLQYTVDEALQSRYIDQTIVSTDNKQIAQVAKALGAAVPFLRPEKLATDTAKIIDTVIHAIGQLKRQREDYDYVVVLQPTQPLRKARHIDEAIETIIDRDGESLVSVSKVKEHPFFMRTVDAHGNLTSILPHNSTVRRQDLPVYYKVNGAIYLHKVNEKLTSETSLNDNQLAYRMESRYDLDIDTPEDLAYFQFLTCDQ